MLYDSSSGEIAYQPTTTFAVPTGAVMSFATSIVPPGWLFCNGTSISRTTYANLFAVIGTTFGSLDANSFNLPEMRGYFVRSWDNTIGTGSIDPGRAFGSIQSHQLQQHKHTITSKWTQPVSGGGDYTRPTMAGTTGTGNKYTSTTTILTESQSYVSDAYNANVGTETRPVNIALMYCIKY